jgi:anti-anti-sigma factor
MTSASGTAAPHAFHGRCDGTLVLRLSGPIRYGAALALRGCVDELLAGEDHGGLLIDLRDVDAIDSTGMGLLARVGRTSLQRRGRRAVIACPDNDVATTLRSAAFDELFVMLDAYPFDDDDGTFTEVPLDGLGEGPSELGWIILDAHRDLSSVSERNREAYADVIAALEADLGVANRQGPDKTPHMSAE